MRMKEGAGGSAPIAIGSELPPTEDKELVLAFKRGEDGSYQAIYERYSPRVSGICRRMLNQSQDAEEAQQETFMRVYTSLPKFNGRYQLGAWVSRIATNVCLDHIRSKGRKPADCASHEMLVDLSAAADENGPEEELLRSDERQKVREVLATLSPTHRAALALREFEGMSYDDIAVALNMTEPQVKALIHRARRAFKKQWAPGLAALLPWRLISKVRRFSSHYDAPPQISDAAASTMHFASSCSVALQQCGQFVSERVLTTMTALVVGAGAVGAGLAQANPPEPEREQITNSVPRRSGDLPLIKLNTDPKLRKEKRKGQTAGAAVHTASEPASVPEPEPKPTQEPEEEAPEGADPSPTPTPNPTYAPVAPAIGWERAGAIAPTAPNGNEMALDCAKRMFSQRLDTVIHDAGASYPALITVEVGTGVAIDFTVRKNEQTVSYSGGSAGLVVAGSARSVEWAGNGSYSHYGPGDPTSVNLPTYGRFTLRLKLDCISAAVIGESLTLTDG